MIKEYIRISLSIPTTNMQSSKKRSQFDFHLFMGCLVLDIILDKTKPKTVNLFLEIKAAKMLFLELLFCL